MAKMLKMQDEIAAQNDNLGEVDEWANQEEDYDSSSGDDLDQYGRAVKARRKKGEGRKKEDVIAADMSAIAVKIEGEQGQLEKKRLQDTLPLAL